MPDTRTGDHPFPPGRVKITQALKTLLARKDFQAIKIAEIAETAGVNEALIYKYFKNKRDLLYQMIVDYLDICKTEMMSTLEKQEGSLGKLETFITALLNIYNRDHVYSKIIMFELRNSSDYYTSTPYHMLQGFYDLCLNIIKDGIADGTFRDDITPFLMRLHIIGSVEQICVNSVITGREISPVDMTASIVELLTGGILGKTAR